MAGRAAKGGESNGHASLARRNGRTAAAAVKAMRDLAAMNVAAATTIAVRTPMIAAAVQDPRRLADPELSLMVTEKVEAAAAAAAAVASKSALAPAVHATRWLGDHAALLARGTAGMATARSADGVWAQWLRMAEGAALINASYGAAMLGAAVDLGAAALKPVHRAATANARRLGRGR